MRRYRVTWDCRKYAPLVWSGDKRKLFGERNEGFILESENLETARYALQAMPYRLNPFYLVIVEETT